MERHGCSINIPARSKGVERGARARKKKKVKKRSGLENNSVSVGGLEKILPADRTGKSDADLRWMSLRLSLASYQD